MNTKPMPAILALIAGFVTCVISFVQRVDITVFARRFIIVCVIFFALGMAARIVIDLNFKDMAEEGDEGENPEKGEEEEEGEQENINADDGDASEKE